MATIAELRALAREIREERQIGGNTGERVGNTFEKVADLLDSTGGDISDILEAVEQLLQDVGFIPRDVMRTATDAGFVNNEGTLLFWLRAATDTLSGLITAANNNKLIALPTAEELAQALAAKQNRLTFDPRPIEGSTNPVTSDGINTAIANFVTRSVSNLIYYYTKSETYTKEEVDALVAAIKQFVPVVAQTLPTASADTMYKLYLIPSDDPQADNVKDEYITIDNGAGANPRYTWEKIGSTDIDLSPYYIKPEGGIPKSDLAEDVQTSLGKADTAFQKPSGGIPLSDIDPSDIDNVPTAGSSKLVKSGGVQNELALGAVYDVSAKNPTAGPNNDGKFTLEYILNQNNVNTLIPSAVRKGGMSIKFVQSSDNKYVQFRYMGTETTGTPNPFLNTANWQGVDAVPTYNSKNLCESGGIQTEIKNVGFLNISAEYPTGGVDSEGQSGGNRYTLTTARGKIPENRFTVGMMITFLNTDGIEEIWQHISGTVQYSSASAWRHIDKVPTTYYSYFRDDVAVTKAYSEGLDEVYINGYILPDYTGISVHCFQSKFYYQIGSESARNIAFSSIEDGQKVELVASINSTDTVVGYVVFKDKSKWTSNSSSYYYALDVSKINKQSLVDGAVTTQKIANGAVTGDKINGIITSELIYDVSANHPTSGVNGSNKYADVSAAANVIPSTKRSAGMTIKFISNVDSLYKVYQRNGGNMGQFTSVKYWREVITQDNPFDYYLFSDVTTKAYTKGLNYIYIEPQYVNTTDIVTARCYQSKLYVKFNGTAIINALNFSQIENNVDIPLVQNIGGVDTTIGKMSFRDKTKWTSNPVSYDMALVNNLITDVHRTYIGGSSEPEDVVKYTYQSLTDEQKQQARTNIGAAKPVTPLVITIPNKVYAVVGTEINIWNDNVSLSIDRGLTSPLNYRIQWTCNKGIQTERGFRYTPIAGDVGTNITCTCRLYNLNNELVAQKSFTIVVLAKNALVSPKNIVCFGASLGASTCRIMYSDFTDSNKFTGTAPNMLGTRGTGDYHYEAVGGYMWSDYATAGRKAYRVYVSGIGGLEVGAVYSITINSVITNLTVREVNTDGGTGNILLEAQYGTAVADFPVSGTLANVSGTGDPTISFDNTGHSDGGETPNNPLWNENTNSLDIALYKQRLGLQSTDKIDAVSFAFGQNDHNLADDLTTLMGYISDLYNAFIGDNPSCKFIIALTITGGNTVDGAGINYGASYNVQDYQNDVYKIRQFYLSLQGSTQYPNIRICPQSLEIDRYYGYNFENRAISQRYVTTEKVHNNFLHPGESGYGQLADSFFATYIGVLTE